MEVTYKLNDVERTEGLPSLSVTITAANIGFVLLQKTCSSAVFAYELLKYLKK
ncbi:hypothetical protein BXY64_2955 [Marinifilum flexuosum]|uniref:Uncharacterized protein n=1 Tax=Marinifilum flexuosum TaxID=1117708 RepID=A0A419WX04_9BACT|nr:hypothetical protein BXY64_2955 [Marinifilum flexuosum]